MFTKLFLNLVLFCLNYENFCCKPETFKDASVKKVNSYYRKNKCIKTNTDLLTFNERTSGKLCIFNFFIVKSN